MLEILLQLFTVTCTIVCTNHSLHYGYSQPLAISYTSYVCANQLIGGQAGQHVTIAEYILHDASLCVSINEWINVFADADECICCQVTMMDM